MAARDYPRSYRVADQIQRDLPTLIRLELKDPRISDLLTISSVDVTRDLSIAKIYFTVLNDAHREQTTDALKNNVGRVRKLLSKKLRMRSVPEIRFFYDTSMEEGVRMSGLINKAVKSNTTSEDDS